MKFLSIFIFILVCSTSTAVLPTYSPAIGDNTRTRDEIIENYFNLGLTAPEIALFLVSVHGIVISLRHLKRSGILRRLGCTRHQHRSDLPPESPCCFSAMAKNVATILFQNTDSRQKLMVKKRQFATATFVSSHIGDR